MKNIFIPIFFVCLCVFSQTSNKSVLAKYTDDEIKIDGVLDENSWEAVAPATAVTVTVAIVASVAVVVVVVVVIVVVVLILAVALVVTVTVVEVQ